VTTPLPGDAREDHAAAVAAAVAAIYAAAELAITDAVAAMARKTVLGQLHPQVARRQVIRGVTAVLDRIRPRVEQVLAPAAAAAARSVTAGPGSVSRGPAVTTTDAAAALDATGLPDQLAAAEDTARRSATAALDAAAQAAGDAAAAGPADAGAGPVNIFRATRDAYRYAVQDATGESRGGAPYSTLSLSRIQAAQKALDDLAEQGITGFTDAAGRRWDLTSYVEMATRTAVSNAWDDLQATAAARSGLDLAMIYTHSTEGSCPRCLPWLGKIISLTGATPGVPTLREAKAAGFRHPNCRCSWLVVGAGQMADVTNPVPAAAAAAAYRASQEQRALERHVRLAQRHACAAVTPAARARAARDLAAARAASAAHRQRTGLRMMKVTVRRREELGAR